MSESSTPNKNKNGSKQESGGASQSHAAFDLLHMSGGGGHGGGDDHGEGNWLVSYADMMTLLVGFFVILLSFASMDTEKFEEARKSITAEFGGTYQVPYAELGDRIREALKKLGVGDQLLLKVSDSGVEISFRGTVFFETGSADLKEEATPVLENLINAVKADTDALDITVEGHTDDVPIVHGKLFRNNWELSSLRACRVLESFIASGLPTSNLTAVGYGDAHPVVPNRDANGTGIPENQSQNRRVVIKLVRHEEPMMMKHDKSAAAPHPATGEASAAPTDRLPATSDTNEPTTTEPDTVPNAVEPSTSDAG